MKFVDHVFDDQVIDRLTVKIILPEGSAYDTFTSVPFIIHTLFTDCLWFVTRDVKLIFSITDNWFFKTDYITDI